MRRLPHGVPATLLVLLALAGCNFDGTAPYRERMDYLTRATNLGISYRAELHRQGTQPNKPACQLGWDNRETHLNVPNDTWGGASSPWVEQVEEAYLKGCMTGAPRPLPEPRGPDAVTPVPHGSEKPRSPEVSVTG